MSGHVINRADRNLPRSRYDVIVIGGGVLGLATAFYLRKFAPSRTVLVVEQGGIPSEEGETHFSPALHHHFFATKSEQHRARWWSTVLADLGRESGVTIALKNGFSRLGYITSEPAAVEMAGTNPRTFRLAKGSEFRGTMVGKFCAFAADASLAVDPDGGCGNAEAVALHYGHGAVALGADLCLNARAAVDRSGDIRLDRLTINNRMQIETERQTRVQAATLVLAGGAATGALIEHQLGEPNPFRRYFAQFPRIDHVPGDPLREDGVLDCPVVSTGDFTIRPHLDGALIIPSPLPPDPEGYVPAGGRLMGVNVGLRKELLTRLVQRMDAIPAFTLPTLNLGKTAGSLRGAWEALTPSGRPECNRLGDLDAYALVGGPSGFSLGPAKALELAAQITGQMSMPWD